MPSWSTLGDWILVLRPGIITTLVVSGVSALLTIAFAALLAAASVSRPRALRLAARVYVDVFRSVPILVLLILLYFGIGKYAPSLTSSVFWLAVAGLTASTSAYLAEIYRGVVQSVPQSQWRAAYSLGVSHGTCLRRVVAPQVVAAGVPGTLNMVISIVKNSSLASLITLPEVTLHATSLVATNFQPFAVYILLGVVYIVMALPLIALSRLAEWGLNRRYGVIVARRPAVRLGAVRSYT